MYYTSNTFQLTKAEIAAIVEFASDDTLRESLSAVHFDPTFGTVTATDGHTLISVRPTVPKSAGDAPSSAFLVRACDLLAASRSMRKGDTMTIELVSPTLSDRSVRATVGTTTTTLALIDAQFPNWQAVVPERAEDSTKDGVRKIGIDTRYLSRLDLISKAIGKKVHAIELTLPTDSLSPVRAFAQDDSATWTAVIMPVRI